METDVRNTLAGTESATERFFTSPYFASADLSVVNIGLILGAKWMRSCKF